MNAYADLTTLKSSSYLNITATDHDAYLRKLLEHASRLLDKECRRFFYCKTQTRYEDGTTGKLFLSADLLSVTTFKTDEDGDGTFEAVFIAADYELYPLNEFPKQWVTLSADSNYDAFGEGVRKGVEIAGLWGYGDGESAIPYTDSGATLTVADGTATTVAASDGTKFAVGQTILCESEQMYITGISGNNLTVKRGINGTTGAAHSAKASYIYDYPEPIRQACLITAMRDWKRKDSAYQDTVGSPETGIFIASKGLDPDVKVIISDYIKARNIFA